MEWPRHYTCEKVLILLSYHDMIERKLGKRDPCHLQPIRVVRTRIRNGIPCFEILWGKPEHYIYSNDQSEDSQNTVSTIEDQVSFQAAYPDMTSQFHRQKAEKEEEKKKQKSKSKRKGRVAPLPDEITQLLAGINLQPSHKDEVAAGSEPVEKCINHETNPSNAPHWNLSTGFSAEDTQIPKEFWGKSRNQIAQPTVRYSAEIGKSSCESLSLTESENTLNAYALSPSTSMLVAEMHLSGIDWSQSFSTPLSEGNLLTQAVTPEQTHLVIDKSCVPMGSISKLIEDGALKENSAESRQDPVQKNMRELFHEDASMLGDLYHLSLKDRILLKNSYQFLSLRQSDPNSSGTGSLSCSSGCTSDGSSPNAVVEPPLQGKFANNLIYFNKKGFPDYDFSETPCYQQEDPTATHHTSPLTQLGKENLMDSMEEDFGIHDPSMYSYQPSRTDNISFKLKENKSAKPRRMKLVNGNASTVQKKSVCYKVSSSSDDSDTENSRMIQKHGVKPRAAESTGISSCIANHSQVWTQQTQASPVIGRAGHTRIDTECIELKLVSNVGVRKTEQNALMQKHSKAHSKFLTSQKNTSTAKTESVSSAVLPRPDLSSVPIFKQLSDDDDSIIVISDSPIPLSERLKL